ncbi:nucleoid-associated protein [Acidiluteibacter ferrifornacis]|uniref:Nucleoid-associated protein n=1 Tax=Acidiluteibacter ferrifornacis TaxID=2692424 RepID=A0A6N9NFC3_9FLAO|nr:nucleoid-associated protein [Acidiluteibacter ferrifornacis]NBG65346.1 nucleoid-associated protein [Acidiluteibacter ferrifornacis]
MINHINSEIKELSVHQVGNKANEEPLNFSFESIDVEDETLQGLLQQYFLKPFTTEEFYNFTFSNGEFELNPLYSYATSIFEEERSFHDNTKKIAQYLYDVSNHPNIKPGDLFVAKLDGIRLNDQEVDVIGIFKSENKHSFIQINDTEDSLTINYESGINIDKLDKGCLIFNRDKDQGYRVCIIDKANRGEEAHYWKDLFLNIKTCNDDYHNTKEFLNIAKSYVTDKMSDEFAVDKTDQIDILNRSVEYFKTKESFNKEEFEETVFQDENVINSFRSFDNNYRTEHEMEIKDEFDISGQAVKKQQRLFKSILKLDKNFHVYIHGDKDLIEKGVESDGRKFYKIYYEKED